MTHAQSASAKCSLSLGKSLNLEVKAAMSIAASKVQMIVKLTWDFFGCQYKQTEETDNIG